MADVNNVVGLDYLKTPSGLCKFIETILCIIAPCLMGSIFSGTAVSLLYSSTISGVVVAVILLVAHVCKIWKENGPKKYRTVSVICCVWSLCLIATGAYIINAVGGNIFFKPCSDAGIVAICAGIVFFVDAVFNCLKDPFWS